MSFFSRNRTPDTAIAESPAVAETEVHPARPALVVDESAAADPIVTFEELGVARDLVAALNERGITSPFPVQVLTIPDALAASRRRGPARMKRASTCRVSSRWQ